ncbi:MULTISPECIES: hypothetical protein [Rhodanobacter]|uniref:hypothetical protein n=1 Tax=Rhodanobacter TaxID=75309 RepID=UPI000411CD6C|nr:MULTISPECIES: hypothetical protein [Rhodanobacter]UJJ54553.1 hypothetical protein LRK53_16630 [Rhodanobacter thiooxydans]
MNIPELCIRRPVMTLLLMTALLVFVIYPFLGNLSATLIPAVRRRSRCSARSA